MSQARSSATHLRPRPMPSQRYRQVTLRNEVIPRLGFCRRGAADWLDFRRGPPGCHFRRWRRRFDFPIAAFLDARSEISVLGALLDDEWRATFRARLIQRL